MCVSGMRWDGPDKVGKGLVGTGSQVSSQYVWMCVLYPHVCLFTIKSTLCRLSFLLLPLGRPNPHGIAGGSEVKASACNAGDLGSIPGSGTSPGEGNGNPLQYSCLENPMDGGALWVTVHGVAKSRTRLSKRLNPHEG